MKEQCRERKELRH